VNGAAFVAEQNIVNDPAEVPDKLQLATDFIADGGHLELYPAARDAGNVGPQALLDELGKGAGPVTFTEVLQFGKVDHLTRCCRTHRKTTVGGSPVTGSRC